jgi:hypothetical protein
MGGCSRGNPSTNPAGNNAQQAGVTVSRGTALRSAVRACFRMRIAAVPSSEAQPFRLAPVFLVSATGAALDRKDRREASQGPTEQTGRQGTAITSSATRTSAERLAVNHQSRSVASTSRLRGGFFALPCCSWSPVVSLSTSIPTHREMSHNSAGG